MIVFDLESDGLLDIATKIHCAVFYDIEKDLFTEFTPANIGDMPYFLDKCPQLSGHNCVCFDLPLIEKVLQKRYTEVVFDTLLAARILFPDLVGKNPHSVDSWGKRFGMHKPVHEDWTTYSPEMLHRCKEDVKIQTKLYLYIQDHLSKLSILDSRITNDKFNDMLQFEQEVCRIIEQQAKNGWAFDLPLAYQLIYELNKTIKNIEKGLIPNLPIRVVRPSEKETKAFCKDGSYTANAINWMKDFDYSKPRVLLGDFSKVQFEPFNLSSSAQVKRYLLDKGWQPINWNYKKDVHNKPIRDERGNHIKLSPMMPKTTEEWQEVADTLQDENIKLLAEYNKANHRKHQIEGFIKNLRSDHRIEAQANTCGSNTARMYHRIVVNVPKADPKIYYGKEMRSLFITAPGKVLVGIDACALEARVEAHYIYPFDYLGAIELIEGDIHAKNAELFECTRNVAKGGKYALTYGCSESKLAKTIGKPQREAKRLYNNFWIGNPGLRQLKELVESAYQNYGYILAIDGRPLTIRYKHALINTLFQSAGSIIMKRALVMLNNVLNKYDFKTGDWKFVGNFHDEIQIECKPHQAELIGELACMAIKDAGEFYKMNVEFKGEYKVGSNWSLTH